MNRDCVVVVKLLALDGGECSSKINVKPLRKWKGTLLQAKCECRWSCLLIGYGHRHKLLYRI